jgi:hypothetical protein
MKNNKINIYDNDILRDVILLTDATFNEILEHSKEIFSSPLKESEFFLQSLAQVANLDQLKEFFEEEASAIEKSEIYLQEVVRAATSEMLDEFVKEFKKEKSLHFRDIKDLEPVYQQKDLVKYARKEHGIKVTYFSPGCYFVSSKDFNMLLTWRERLKKGLLCAPMDAAEKLGLEYTTLFEYIKKGIVETFRVGKYTYVDMLQARKVLRRKNA